MYSNNEGEEYTGTVRIVLQKYTWVRSLMTALAFLSLPWIGATAMIVLFSLFKESPWAGNALHILLYTVGMQLCTTCGILCMTTMRENLEMSQTHHEHAWAVIAGFILNLAAVIAGLLLSTKKTYAIPIHAYPGIVSIFLSIPAVLTGSPLYKVSEVTSPFLGSRHTKLGLLVLVTGSITFIMGVLELANRMAGWTRFDVVPHSLAFVCAIYTLVIVVNSLQNKTGRDTVDIIDKVEI